MLKNIFEKTLFLQTLLILQGPVDSGVSWSPLSDYHDIAASLPEFDQHQQTELIAAVGQTVFIPCTVHNLGDKTVAWIRNRDLNILTHGDVTFTADPRFHVHYNHEMETWSLSIKSARVNDTGRYECQVNTDPKMSKFFNLKVQEHIPPHVSVHIPGPAEQTVLVGSTVTFTCSVVVEPISKRQIDKSCNVITWLHNRKPLTYKAERGGISEKTDLSSSENCRKLTVAGVSSKDAGKYTCSSGDSEDTVVLIVVLDNESYHHNGYHDMDAMQRDQATSNSIRIVRSILTGFMHIFLYFILKL